MFKKQIENNLNLIKQNISYINELNRKTLNVIHFMIVDIIKYFDIKLEYLTYELDNGIQYNIISY